MSAITHVTPAQGAVRLRIEPKGGGGHTFYLTVDQAIHTAQALRRAVREVWDEDDRAETVARLAARPFKRDGR